jgi:hypothetical protein
VAEKPTAAEPIKQSDYPAIFARIESSLEAARRNPQAVLEAVVGIDKGVARYDRDGIMSYFQARPQLMIARAFDFLQVYVIHTHTHAHTHTHTHTHTLPGPRTKSSTWL